MTERQKDHRPRIVGIGGTARVGSSTEAALAVSLRRAEALGAETRLFGGEFLNRLPTFDPRPGERDAAQAELIEAVRGADGVVIASPGYHGSISGLIKNALDTLELTAKDASPYLTGKAVGAIVTAYGSQAGGTTLMTLRTIIHALRGWPTPFGAALISDGCLFDDGGGCRDPKHEWALATVAEEVVQFTMMRCA